jgi:hypothetical protein
MEPRLATGFNCNAVAVFLYPRGYTRPIPGKKISICE